MDRKCYICNVDLKMNDKVSVTNGKYRHTACFVSGEAELVKCCIICGEKLSDALPIYPPFEQKTRCEQCSVEFKFTENLLRYGIHECYYCNMGFIIGDGIVSAYVGKNSYVHIKCKALDTAPDPEPETEPETVNHPAHYGGGDNVYEVIKIIDAHGHGESFCIGNALKYILRYKEKNGAEDLKKAIWYLQHVVEQKNENRY